MSQRFIVIPAFIITIILTGCAFAAAFAAGRVHRQAAAERHVLRMIRWPM